MSRFEVWAPGRQRVDLLLVGHPGAAAPGGDVAGIPMEPGPGGWWRAEVQGLAAGSRYWYSLDGGPPRPDPRSPWQPEGVDGPSATVDHGAFRWHDGHWQGFDFPHAIIYELHVGTFSPEGTFEGAISRLGHISALGANAVELMPVAEASGKRGWGYDGAQLWAPHHAYGGPVGLKRLVDACHRRGLAVILDVVYNHLGPVGNYLPEFGPYFTDRYQTPWGWAVNFDGPGSHEVRDYVVANALMWLRDYHFDGLRLDAVHAVFDESALHILEELAAAVSQLSAQLGRELWLVAESDRNDPRLVRPRSSFGYGLSACWDDDFHHALHAVLTGERDGYYADFGRLGQLAKALESTYVYDGQFSAFRQRRQGRPVGDLPSSCFVGYLQDHDQVGNRPLGSRMATLVSPDLVRVGLALVLLGPLVPMVFQGEEWGASTPFFYFTDHADPGLGEAVREGRLREHPLPPGISPDRVPGPQDEATFLRSKLDWSERAREPHRSVLDWCRQLISLRRQVPDFRAGERSATGVAYDEEGRWLVLHRGGCHVAVNFAGTPRDLPVPAGPPLRVALASRPLPLAEGSLVAGSVALPPSSVAVLVPSG